MANPNVCVTVVTYNSDRYIRRCLESIFLQEGAEIEVIVVDNGSTDGTRAILKEFKGRVRRILCDRNLGFAEGQNRAIRASSADWVLTLNPGRSAEAGFHPQPGRGRRNGRSRRRGLRKAAFDRPRVRAAARSADRFHRYLLYSRDAALRPRLARARRAVLGWNGIRLRGQRRRGAFPPAR